MLEEKLARVRKLMEQRDKIDAELGEMLGTSTAPKRGRPRKEQGTSHSVSVGESHTESQTTGWSTAQSTGNGLSGEKPLE